LTDTLTWQIHQLADSFNFADVFKVGKFITDEFINLADYLKGIET